MSEPLSGSFFDAWDTYQKVVAGDYMFHREIGVEMNRVLRARFDARSFSFLDLGCGDAAALAPLLEGLPIQRYKGVDLSETALALAAENLKALPCPTHPCAYFGRVDRGRFLRRDLQQFRLAPFAYRTKSGIFSACRAKAA